MGLKQGVQTNGSAVDEPKEDFEINNNNMIFDGPTATSEEPPIYYFDHIDQIYPIGSLCRLVASSIEGQYIAYLRSEIRFEINPQNYKNTEGPIMYLTGKTLKN